jgi:uncharacterized protein (DUF2126 family)
VFSQGLDRIAGYALPIARDAGATRWQTGSWFMRAERCYLAPGDSPMGYRLPLDSQPWVTRGDYPYVHPTDQTQSFPSLARYAQVRQQLRDIPGRDAADAATDATRAESGRLEDARVAALARAMPANRLPAAKESAGWVTRTALCVEPRNGVLYVFMPPLERAEDYLELVAAVEATSAATGLPVLLEGYEPPGDPRLNQFRITPDPGVIEANIHPSHSWKELVERTTFLYEAARESRLGTEKFMLDGRHTGTGGGNHFVLGGATPLDSPFIRRPDVLASLLAYWHNHPSLSYLFSGMFIGPHRRHRASMKHAMIRCTSWNWRFNSCRSRVATCRRGSPIGCSAIC